MEQIITKRKCTGCTTCMNICPKKAISMQEDNNGFKYYVIDNKKCINCGRCRKVCPVLNYKNEEQREIIAYSCYNKNEKERMISSSGGIFILLAKEIIKRNGVVFGVSFDSLNNVVHTYAETYDDLTKFMGSKYVQSDIGECYKKAKLFLDLNRYVLFTGTPCQIEGLISYLGKKYEKLYTQDIICHGVPSPKVWRKYLKYRKDIDGLEPQSISFRNKDNGWNNFNMKILYENKIYIRSHEKDEFMQSFLKNTCLRESCYDCSFKKKSKNSDITLGDFWGIYKVDRSMYDNKGTSLVLINSEKGYELFDLIKNDVVYKDINAELAYELNPALKKSAVMDKNRDIFFANIDLMPFDTLVKKYTHQYSVRVRILKKMKKIVLLFLKLKSRI